MHGTTTALHWAPRILGICVAVLISVFAFDVFAEGYTFWKTIGAFFLHLVPTYVLLGVLLLAWRWELAGAVVFIALGVLYPVWSGGRFALVAYLLISGPLILTGILFLLSWASGGRARRASRGA